MSALNIVFFEVQRLMAERLRNTIYIPQDQKSQKVLKKELKKVMKLKKVL